MIKFLFFFKLQKSFINFILFDDLVLSILTIHLFILNLLPKINLDYEKVLKNVEIEM